MDLFGESNTKTNSTIDNCRKLRCENAHKQFTDPDEKFTLREQHLVSLRSIKRTIRQNQFREASLSDIEKLKSQLDLIDNIIQIQENQNNQNQNNTNNQNNRTRNNYSRLSQNNNDENDQECNEFINNPPEFQNTNQNYNNFRNYQRRNQNDNANQDESNQSNKNQRRHYANMKKKLIKQSPEDISILNENLKYILQQTQQTNIAKWFIVNKKQETLFNMIKYDNSKIFIESIITIHSHISGLREVELKDHLTTQTKKLVEKISQFLIYDNKQNNYNIEFFVNLFDDIDQLIENNIDLNDQMDKIIDLKISLDNEIYDLDLSSKYLFYQIKYQKKEKINKIVDLQIKNQDFYQEQQKVELRIAEQIRQCSFLIKRSKSDLVCQQISQSLQYLIINANKILINNFFKNKENYDQPSLEIIEISFNILENLYKKDFNLSNFTEIALKSLHIINYFVQFNENSNKKDKFQLMNQQANTFISEKGIDLINILEQFITNLSIANNIYSNKEKNNLLFLSTSILEKLLDGSGKLCSIFLNYNYQTNKFSPFLCNIIPSLTVTNDSFIINNIFILYYNLLNSCLHEKVPLTYQLKNNKIIFGLIKKIDNKTIDNDQGQQVQDKKQVAITQQIETLKLMAEIFKEIEINEIKNKMKQEMIQKNNLNYETQLSIEYGDSKIIPDEYEMKQLIQECNLEEIFDKNDYQQDENFDQEETQIVLKSFLDNYR